MKYQNPARFPWGRAVFLLSPPQQLYQPPSISLSLSLTSTLSQSPERWLSLLSSQLLPEKYPKDLFQTLRNCREHLSFGAEAGLGLAGWAL